MDLATLKTSPFGCRHHILNILLLILSLLFGLGLATAKNKLEGVKIMNFQISSVAFSDKSDIPSMYTCEGANIAPPLHWENPPNLTKSFALIVDDPDAPDPAAPKRVFVHWVLFNIPASIDTLAEGVTEKTLPKGTIAGKNDIGDCEYHGPCPPIGRHRYFFKLYALDTVFSDLKKPTKNELLEKMKGHILEQTELIGTYIKK